jgi:hypothetical protein
MIQQRYSTITVPIKNQFQSDSCGGQAASYFIGIANALTNKTPYVEVSAKSVYSPIVYPEGGTTVHALQNQVCNKGATKEIIVPSYHNGTTDEPWMTDTSWETPPNLILASANANWIAVTVPIDLDSIATAIRDNYATIWEIQGVNNGTWLSDHPVPPVSNSGLWGHFMCQPSVGMKEIISLQSWGVSVGDSCYQRFSDYISSGYIVDCWTFVPKYVPHPILPNQQIPNPQVLTWQQRLVNYFLALFGK